MSLNIAKLTKVKRLDNGRVIARCPACAAVNQDQDGNHLVVYPDGRFGCVLFPGRDGQQHRKTIWTLAGDRQQRRPPLILKFTVRSK